MSFRQDYSGITSVELDGSMRCFDVLDNFTHNMRDENSNGLFGYRYDPEHNYSYYTFYGLDDEIPMGSTVTVDREVDTIGIEFGNRIITFHLPTVQKQITELKEAKFYALRN